MAGNGITYIGVTNYRNANQRFGIKDRDRLQHIYVIGKSGTGKSTLLLNMAISDIRRGNGICLIDPHGDIATAILRSIPNSRKHDLIHFNATDENPLAFNPLEGIGAKHHHLVASGLISTFKKVWSESWGPRMEYILRFALLTLLSVPGSTLLDIQPLLTSKDFREKASAHVTDEHVLNFWNREFERYSPAMRAEAISPILNKTGLFITCKPLRDIVGQKATSFRFGHIMNASKILIANLSKGQIGEEACSLLGAMLINSLQLAATYRAAMPEADRTPFYLYIDECHSFVTLAFAGILSEARKYGLSLFMAHQYMDQLDERVRSAVFGNVGTIISFRVGAADSEFLSKEFYPVFDVDDFVNLSRHAMYLKLAIDGMTTPPFSAVSQKVN